MSFLQRFRLRRAAKAYALRLPETLRKGYGGKKHYTPAQIRSAVTKARLDPRFIALGYAAFMTEEAFNAAAGEMPVRMSYAEARAILRRYAPSMPSGGWNTPESGLDQGTASIWPD